VADDLTHAATVVLGRARDLVEEAVQGRAVVDGDERYYYDTTGTGNVVIGDGTATADKGTAAMADKTEFVLVGVRSVAGDTVQAYKNGTATGAATADATTATLANALALTIGATNAGAASFANMEFYKAAVFREVLSATEILSLQSEMLPGGGQMMMLGVG